MSELPEWTIDQWAGMLGALKKPDRLHNMLRDWRADREQLEARNAEQAVDIAELKDCNAPMVLHVEGATKADQEIVDEWEAENKRLQAVVDRLLVLGFKWCDKKHPDWEELERHATEE